MKGVKVMTDCILKEFEVKMVSRHLTKTETRKAELEETIDNLQWSLDVDRKDLMRKTIEKAIAIIQVFGIDESF